MKITKSITMLMLAVALMAGITSCKKYRKYDNKEVIEDTYAGTFNITGSGDSVGGDFLGSNETGTVSFVWTNNSKKANVNFDISTNTGSVQCVVNDAKGKEVLNVTRSAGGNDTFSGVTEEGKSGNWLITFILTDFNGDGSYSVSSGS